MSFVPLVAVARAGLDERVIHGALAWASPEGVVHAVGDDPVIYARSTTKPLVIHTVADALTDLDPAQRASAVASPNGEAWQVRVARSILRERQRDAILTPPAFPMKRTGPPAPRRSPWLHPCAGEHAAIVRACQALGWDPATYTHPDHPLHARVHALLHDAVGAAPVAVATDGCGLPTEALRLGTLARWFAHWAARRDTSWVWDAMVARPDLIGGPGRLDTAILTAGEGRLVAKEGADGLLVVAVADPAPRALVVKIAHGWDPWAAWVVAREALVRVGVALDDPVAPAGQTVRLTAPVGLPPGDAACV